MRVKKQKRHRRIIRFYTVCFGFRQPYKVLCDGTFVHHLLVNQITPADTALSNILSGPVKLFTTRCVLAELKRLGSSHSESLDAAHKLAAARCDHEKVKSADACIMEVIGESNSEHFFVATQDTNLRKKLQEVPGVPLVFGLRNALFLEQPSAFQHQYAKTSEEERLHMTKSEYKMLEKRTKKILTTDDEGDLSDKNEGSGDQSVRKEAVIRPRTGKREIGVKDRVQFKRKKAKGPNPLSCKKKKNHKNQNPVFGKGKKDGDNTVRSRSRKRKRHEGKKEAETNS